MTYNTTVSAPGNMATSTLTPSPSLAPKATPNPTLESNLQAALEHARRLAQMQGISNTDMAIAWETVEELQKAYVQRQQNQITPFAQYCIDHPDAPECRLYED